MISAKFTLKYIFEFLFVIGILHVIPKYVSDIFTIFIISIIVAMLYGLVDWFTPNGQLISLLWRFLGIPTITSSGFAIALAYITKSPRIPTSSEYIILITSVAVSIIVLELIFYWQ